MSSDYAFVYGTLKGGEPNYHWITNRSNGSAEFVGAARTVERYPLVIATEYNVPFLLYYPGHGNNIIGEVYKVDEAMLRSLDILEDHPRSYVREIDDVQLLSTEGNGPAVNGDVVKCWVYFIKTFKADLLQLPFLEDYSDSGPHGLRYIEPDMRDPQFEYVEARRTSSSR